MPQSVPWIPLFLLTGALLLGLARIVWVRRDRPGALLFSLVMVTGGVYTLLTTAQVAALSLEAKLFWLKAQYPAILALPVLTLLFALDYTGRDRWITWRWAGVLSVVPVAALVLVWTEPGHGLFFRTLHVQEVAGLYDIEYALGPLGAVVWGYAYLCFLITALIFLDLAVRPNPEYRRQGAALLIAFVAPVILGAVVLLQTGVPTDITPFALLVSGTCITWTLVSSSFLTVVPIDREAAFEELRGAVLVVDRAGTVVDTNQSGTQLFGDDAVGRPAGEVFERAGFDAALSTLSDGDVLATGEEDGRQFEVATQSITSRLGTDRGSIVLFYDISDRLALERQLHETNEQLSVLNRVLRHDVRNHVSVIAGHADMLDEHVGEDRQHSVEAIARAATHIGELTRVARDISESLAQEEATDHRPVDAGEVLEDAIESANVRYPEASFDEPESYPSVTVVANTLLSSVFTNLLNNAVQHNDSDAASVDVEATATDDTLRVRIADNGPGISDAHKERIFGRGHRGLESSGSGLGLYLVERLLQDFGGEVTVSDNEPRGAVFEIQLPVAAETDRKRATLE
jgi:signal transduction histidine kinase